jgi:muramoyltetrapeptide carboxypeptidase
MDRRKFITGSLLVTGGGLLAPTMAKAESKAFASGTWPGRIVKPKKLSKGDTIGLITPSSALSRGSFESTLKNMEALGFKVKYSDNMRVRKGFLAGTDQQRLDDLHAMFADTSVDGIFCARGGYGAGRLLPGIDYGLIASNPKAFIGYSDITALHFAIFNKTGLVTFHGPVGASNFTDYTAESFEDTLIKGKGKIRIEQAKEDRDKQEDYIQIYSISEGVAKGELVGGNLSLVSSLAGTPFDLDFTGKLVFLEEVGESPYRVDRMLTQLLLAGKLQAAKGIVLGVFSDCDEKDTDPDFGDKTSLKETLAERLGGLGIPVLYGMSFGHVSNIATLPMGISAELDTYKQSLTLLEESVL